MNRRKFLSWGGLMAAAPSIGSLSLANGATPTGSTPDVHDFLSFIGQDGLPRVSPAAKWEASHRDILGPYYAPNAPFRGKVTAPLEPGETLLVRGRVWSYQTRKPIPNALLDVWQADAEGRYDKSAGSDRLKISQFRNRLRLLTDETGYYEFETVKPGRYQQGGQYRPSHIHYLVQAFGHKQLITQLYFQGDPYNDKDQFARKSNLIVGLEPVKAPGGVYQRAAFDIVLEPGTDPSPKQGSGAEQPQPYYLPSTGTVTTLDQDSDGKLSTAEIEAAARVLRRLDGNRDGILTAEELIRLTRG